MKIINCSGENFVTLKVVHRKGYTIAELVEPPNGQITVNVFDTEWCKKYRVLTHPRYFRSKQDALKFIQKTFK